jgi:hypothetical protein
LIVFGFFGWGTFDSSTSIINQNDLFVTLSILFSMTGIFIFRDKINEFLPKVRISGELFLSFMCFMCLGVLLNFSQLRRALTGDELFYARQAQIYSVELLIQFGNHLPEFISSQNSSHFLHLFSFLSLASVSLFLISIMKIKSDKTFLVVSLLVLFAIRQIIQLINPNTHVLSPLPSAWYFVTTSIFGISSSAFRLSTLLLYSFLAAYIYVSFRGKGKISNLASGFCSISLFSIPLIDQLTTLVEPAGWTFITAIVLLVRMIKNDFTALEFYLFFLAFSTYLRMNTGFLLVALIISYLLGNQRKSKPVSFVLFICSSILLPGFVITFILRISQRFSSGESMLTVLDANVSNTLGVIEANNAQFYIIIIAFGIVLMLKQKSSRVFVIGYLGMATLLFQLLQFPYLSGYVKYLAEYLYPLIFAAIFVLVSKLSGSMFRNGVILTLLFSVNAFGFATQLQTPSQYRKAILEPRPKIEFGLNVMPYAPYPYKEVFNYIKEKDVEHCFNAGIVYGIIPEIQAGYSIKDVLESNTLRENFLINQSLLQEDSVDITANSVSKSKLNCIILGSIRNQEDTVRQLKTLGWTVKYTASDLLYGTKIYLMVSVETFDPKVKSGSL